MKKTIFKLSSLLLAAALFIASCVEDKGNYTYIELNQIEFGGINELYSIDVGMPITIRPEIYQTLPGNEANHEYLWLRLNDNRGWDTVYRAKYLDDVTLPLAGGRTHAMVYQVLDHAHKVNGIPVTYTSPYFRIQVNNDIRTGFMLLLDDDGETDLRFINWFNLIPGEGNFGSKLVMRSIPRSPNLPEDLGKPLNVLTFVDNNAPAPGGRSIQNVSRTYNISLVTENGIFRYDFGLLEYEPTYNVIYTIVGIPAEVDAIRYSNLFIPSNKTAISNSLCALGRTAEGNFMFYRFGAVTMPGAVFMPWSPNVFCNRYRDSALDDTFTAFPIPGLLNNFVAVFYDMDNRRFAFKPPASNFCDPFSETIEQPLFPYNNTPFEPVWMFMAPSYLLSVTNFNNVVHSVVRDRATGAIDQISFSAASAVNAPQIHRNKLWPVTDRGDVLPGINQATLFAINYNGDYRHLLFWAYGGAIYTFDMADGTFRQVFTAPAGHTVTGMKVIQTAGSSGSTVLNNDFIHNMVVATKGSGPNSTSVGIYQVAPIYGNLTLRRFENSEGGMDCIWTGLPDYVGVDWKAR
ncbi:MAG: PKD-like family lipoprotein [Rikenellaceae bacterium]|nr:PKD-like family lipoprotein [Rikenellaceae bacterium]